MVSFIHSTCREGDWDCTNRECDATCTVYGEGHYITFDDKKFSFNGGCSYIFAQVYTLRCGVFLGGSRRGDLWWPWDWHLYFVGLLWKQQEWHLQGRDWEHPVRNDRKHLLHLHQALLRGRQNNQTSAIKCCPHQNNKLTCFASFRTKEFISRMTILKSTN